MENFKCDDCGKIWTFKEIIPSVQKYGFVNLVGDDNELIAFDCPNQQCFSTVKKYTYPGGSKEFHRKLVKELDPHDYGGNEFKYFSSLPFSKSSSNILNSYEVVEYLATSWEIEHGGVPQLGLPSESYFSSFNFDIQSIFSQHIRILYYRVGDVERLLSRETREKQKLFPRYLHASPLFQYVDNFLQTYFLKEKSIIDFSIANDGETFNTDQQKQNENGSNEDAKSTGFVNPEIFYKVLAGVPPNQPDPLSCDHQKYKEFTGKLSDHNNIIRELSTPYANGELHGHLATLAKDFVCRYIDDFQQYKLCYDSLWDFKEGYLKKLHQGWKSDSLTLKSKPVLKHPDTIVKEKCQAMAKKLHELNNNLSFDDIMSNPDIKHLAQRPYREPGREGEIKTYPRRRLTEWLKPALPKEMHPKPGRKSNK